jgi:hypothetical protein
MTATATQTEQLVLASDYIELSRLVTEHANRNDSGHADTIYELYAEDGELDIGTGTLHGREAIREWGRKLVESPPWRTIRHAATNMRFVYDGPDAAEGTTMLTVFMVAGSNDATTLPWNVGEDHDRFVRTAEGWRIASRRWVNLFSRGDAIPLP